MAENSNISWTNHTFNPWIGCSKVSPACANCYAERDWDKRYGRVKWGPQGTRSLTSGDNWKEPPKWNRKAEKSGKRLRVFCASLADVFENWDGPVHDHHGNQIIIEPHDGPIGLLTMDDVRKRLFRLIDATPNLDWLLLTKRPENILDMWPTPAAFGMLSKFYGSSGFDGTGSQPMKPLHRSNVWLGCSVENQGYADKRIPELLKCRDLSPVLFLSCEPLLGPLDLANVRFDYGEQTHLDSLKGTHHNSEGGGYPAQKVDWVICGGESGPNSRPSHLGWFRSLRDQCAEAAVPFHFKQLSQCDDKNYSDFATFPEDLKIRELPMVAGQRS